MAINIYEKKILLLFNLPKELVKSVEENAAFIGCAVKEVPPRDHYRTVGFLAGLRGCEGHVSAPKKGEAAAGRMIVIGGFTREGLDVVLALLRRAKVDRGTLKAVLTPDNVKMSAIQLYEEIRTEDGRMKTENRT